MLVDLSSIVPDGIVCYFTSYQYMQHVIVKWSEMGFLTKILENKLILVETKDTNETMLALESYKKACDTGRGAVFFALARGKVAQGVDFNKHYGRCIILFGVPFLNLVQRNSKARMQFIEAEYKIANQEFLKVEAMRQTAQCVAGVLHSKEDYGLLIFADKRYKSADLTDKLPQWIKSQIEFKNRDLSTDVVVQSAKMFFTAMSQ